MMHALPFLPDPPALILRGINALLVREPWAARRLAEHAGKSVRLSLTESWVMQVSIGSDGSLSACDQAVTADVALSIPAGRRSELWAAWRRGGPAGVKGLMHIQGDAGLAQLVSELAAGLRWDVEDDLSHVVGDVAALRLMAGARQLGAGLQQSLCRLQDNLAEYLGEESGLVLQRSDFRSWQADLQQLHGQIDALDKRLRAAEPR